MNGIGTKGKAKNLMKTITRFSEIMVKQKNVFPNGGNALDVEFVLVPMSAFLVSGFANDNDVAFQMLPTYQKKIMPYVNKEEYDEKTARFQELFTEYREKAIEVQENNEHLFRFGKFSTFRSAENGCLLVEGLGDGEGLGLAIDRNIRLAHNNNPFWFFRLSLSYFFIFWRGCFYFFVCPSCLHLYFTIYSAKNNVINRFSGT